MKKTKHSLKTRVSELEDLLKDMLKGNQAMDTGDGVDSEWWDQVLNRAERLLYRYEVKQISVKNPRPKTKGK